MIDQGRDVVKGNTGMNQVTVEDLKSTVGGIDKAYASYRAQCLRTYGPDWVARMEAEPLHECPNCHGVIADDESFCGEDCKREFLTERSESPLDQENPDGLECEKNLPHQTGEGECL